MHEAQSFASLTTLLWVSGTGIIVGGIALAASGNGDETPATTTTFTAP